LYGVCVFSFIVFWSFNLFRLLGLCFWFGSILFVFFFLVLFCFLAFRVGLCTSCTLSPLLIYSYFSLFKTKKKKLVTRAYFLGQNFQQRTWSLEGTGWSIPNLPTPAYSVVFWKTWSTMD
jgi:hypothetical protein